MTTRKAILAAAGLVLVGVAGGFGILYGASVHKLAIGLAGLLFVATAWRTDKLIQGYKAAALILLNTLVLLVSLEAAAAIAWFVWGHDREPFVPKVPAYYASQTWGAGYLREADQIDHVKYAPYVMWKTEPYQGRFVNIDSDGNRVTPGAQCGPNAYTVFMFGGSTMWGFGVPDWGTIPAYVQSEFAKWLGKPVCVRNFGQPGWVSAQSVIELLRQLQSGDTPDLVIFSEGFNDVGVLWSDGEVGGPYDFNGARHRFERGGMRVPLGALLSRTSLFQWVERFAPQSPLARWRPGPRAWTGDAPAAADAIVGSYLLNYRAVTALAHDYGFASAYFLQPSLHYAHEPLTPEERAMADEEETRRPGMPQLLRMVYGQIKVKSRGQDRFFFFADDVAKAHTVYLDGAHLTHAGNEEVAKRMVTAVR